MFTTDALIKLSPLCSFPLFVHAVLPLMKHAAGCARRGCRLLLHGFVRSAVIGAAFVLLCLLMVPQIPAGLLYLTGRRDWCHQLAVSMLILSLLFASW